MPDFERVMRKLAVHIAPEDQKPVVEAYHKGLDRARVEVVYIVLFVAVIFVLFGVFVA